MPIQAIHPASLRQIARREEAQTGAKSPLPPPPPTTTRTTTRLHQDKIEGRSKNSILNRSPLSLRPTTTLMNHPMEKASIIVTPPEGERTTPTVDKLEAMLTPSRTRAVHEGESITHSREVKKQLDGIAVSPHRMHLSASLDKRPRANSAPSRLEKPAVLSAITEEEEEEEEEGGEEKGEEEEAEDGEEKTTGAKESSSAGADLRSTRPHSSFSLGAHSSVEHATSRSGWSPPTMRAHLLANAAHLSPRGSFVKRTSSPLRHASNGDRD